MPQIANQCVSARFEGQAGHLRRDGPLAHGRGQMPRLTTGDDERGFFVQVT